MPDRNEHNAYVALHAFLAGALGNGRQAEQKARIILQELGRLSDDQLEHLVDLIEDWYVSRR